MPPQYLNAVDMKLHIAGKSIDTRKADRAVWLFYEKYRSSYNFLRKDMRVNITYVIQDRGPTNGVSE